MDAQETARMFRVLGAAARVRLIELLKAGPLCVNALAARLGMSAAAVSQHLRILRDAGLVRGEKRGNFVHYRLDGERLDSWRKIVDEVLAPVVEGALPCLQDSRPSYCPAMPEVETTQQEEDDMCGEKQSGCRHPERLQGRPEECSPEQIRQCHGDAAGHPCVPASGCQHPDQLKGRPEECSPEQIRRCHGNAAGHPCV